MKISLPVTRLIFVLAPLLLSAENGWALQSHGAPEGFYTHQIAHLLFSGALAYLYFHTRSTPATGSRGWRYLQIFCVIFICWNLLAFTGHELFERLADDDFLAKGTWHEQLTMPLSLIKVTYYITKMDHLLNVPAFFALVLSLKRFYQDAVEEESA